MGVDYDAHLVIGWPVEIPEDEEGDTVDVDDYLSPLCKFIGKKATYVTEGSAFTGRENYYISITNSEDTDEILAAIAARDKLRGKLLLSAVKLGPFCIKAVGHVW
jgi:hypothetical protein